MPPARIVARQMIAPRIHAALVYDVRFSLRKSTPILGLMYFPKAVNPNKNHV